MGERAEDVTRPGAHPAVARAVLVVPLACAAAAVGLLVANDPQWTYNQWYFAVDLTNAVVYGLVAWLILARRAHPVAWIIAATAIGGGLAALSFEWTEFAVTHPDLPAIGPLETAQQWAWIPGAVALKAVVPWLVRADPLDRAARLAVGAGIGATVLLLALRLNDPWLGWGDPKLVWSARLVVALGLIAAVDVVRRWRRLPVEQARGLGWLALGVLIKTLAFVPLTLPATLADGLPVWFTPALSLLSEPIFPAAVLVVILRQQLWGIDMAVSRTLVWSLLTAGVVGAYLGIVTLLTPLFERDGAPQMLATALVAIGFQPGHSWLQRRVDRLVHGESATRLGAVRRIGVHLGAAGTDNEVLSAVVGSLVGSLRLGSAALWAPNPTGPDASLQLLAEVGEPSGEEVVVHLANTQGDVGRLVVTARAGERLSGRARTSLDEVAPLVAATIQLATTRRALLQSRRRLADARDEERRALRRELHDGLGPALAGVNLGLQAARNQLASDPATAATLLDQLIGELERRVDEVRGLARGLLPPALGDAGLPAALHELTERYAVTGLAVTLDSDDDSLASLTPEVTTTVYAIVAEAVRNVHRHAGAGRCDVQLWVDSALWVVVADNGIGIDPTSGPGVGLTSMRERAEGLGGTFRFTTQPFGGSRLEVTVPPVAWSTP